MTDYVFHPLSTAGRSFAASSMAQGLQISRLVLREFFSDGVSVCALLPEGATDISDHEPSSGGLEQPNPIVDSTPAMIERFSALTTHRKLLVVEDEIASPDDHFLNDINMPWVAIDGQVFHSLVVDDVDVSLLLNMLTYGHNDYPGNAYVFGSEMSVEDALEADRLPGPLLYAMHVAYDGEAWIAWMPEARAN